jgi:hypothetical protein
MNELENRRARANEARQFLQNPLFRDSFAAVEEYLNEQALGCDPDNEKKAQRIVLSKQLLAGIKRELVRKIEDGDMAIMQMAEIERRGVRHLFRR